jgi:hypothetical protein
LNYQRFLFTALNFVGNNATVSTISKAIYNTATQPNVNATGNWWGAASGPYASTNTSGTGDSVTDNVNFSSYVSSGLININNATACPRPPEAVIPAETIPPTATVVFATNTPMITNTPATLTSAQMAQLFLVPMIDNTNPVNPITLAPPIEYADRTSNPPKICSRDLNPVGEANNYPLIAPEAGDVVIIDDTWGDTSLSGQPWSVNYNAGLGRFIVTRIAVSQLDDNFVRTVNQNVAGTNSSSLNLVDGGWLFIAYAHLQNIDSSILSTFNANSNAADYTYPVTKGQVLGVSGNSNVTINHLDLTVFYVPPYSKGPPKPSEFGLPEGKSPFQRDLRKWYNSFYRIFRLPNDIIPVNRINVDPVILWPILADNSGSTYQTIIMQNCLYLPVNQN